MKGLKRDNLYGYVEHDIKREVKRLARKFDCSMRLVINTALSDALGIDAEDKYYNEQKKEK